MNSTFVAENLLVNRRQLTHHLFCCFNLDHQEAESAEKAAAAKAAADTPAPAPAPTPAPKPAPAASSAQGLGANTAGASGGRVLPKEEISPELRALLQVGSCLLDGCYLFDNSSLCSLFLTLPPLIPEISMGAFQNRDLDCL